VLIEKAHQVCNEGLGHGVTVQDMHSTLVEWGHSSKDAATLIAQAGRYVLPALHRHRERSGRCRARVGRTDSRVRTPSPRRSKTTGSPSQYRTGDPVSTLANISDQASDGLPRMRIARLFVNGWGLCQRDAVWLVNIGLAKCGSRYGRRRAHSPANYSGTEVGFSNRVDAGGLPS
jgi:hypothetical protein